ncbi:hypothetical protein [Leadbetterella byssophila]|uniref:Uncharacterized protein n=1 Tax=Leadbetterella byssophila (strain DSM 17132 / JCM 16389 / KACC 11308 / NBRC 106382 / 4M15) TaxID=649349 RepID=E4RY40_LEAB4|nr:hypothetical protein [Leadbetterella byssophila]ADQ16368.1 hypothetical protein Lbys_0606 [Leadbetterella byssophila DSM 17132]
MIVKYKKAPGQRMIKRLSLRQKSWLHASGGAILFSIGQCLFAVSWFKLFDGYHAPTWIFMIILGLVLTLTGLLIMGKALVFSSHIKARKYFKKRQNSLIKKSSQHLENAKLKIERTPKK